jgi:hypothetical protein
VDSQEQNAKSEINKSFKIVVFSISHKIIRIPNKRIIFMFIINK